ncbi:MAG: hydrogenase maturation peptidase HycI [Candidatus Hadarchaeum sp.]
MIVDLSSFLNQATRIAIVGVGSDLRGDDAVGVEIVRKLRNRIKSPKVLLLEGGVAPENYTSQIRRFRPSHIILIDAADFGARAGDVIVADPGAIAGRPVSTHTIPLSVLTGYLKEQTGAEVVLLGIQPGQVDLGSKMCEAVKNSMNGVLEMLTEVLKQF